MVNRADAKKNLKILSTLLAALTAFLMPSLIAGAAGSLQWNSPYDDGEIISDAPGEISSNPVNQFSPATVRTTDGNFVIVWADNRNETDTDIYAQKINSLGVVQWLADGAEIISATGNQPSSGEIALAASDDGGAIMAWTDSRTTPDSVYIQKIDADGAELWTANGIQLDTESANPVLLDDGSGGVYALWENDGSGDIDIYFTRVLSTGSLDEDFNPPIVIGESGSDEFNPKIINATGGAVIVSYENDYSSGPNDIKLMKYDTSDGSELWTGPATAGVGLVDASGLANHDTVSDGNGGAYIVYELQMTGNNDIYLQRVDTSGTLDITNPGKAICVSTGSQTNPHVVSDNLNTPSGVIVSWDDPRAGSYTDIYTQRVDGSLTSRFVYNGKSVSLTGDNKSQSGNMITTNGANGAIITFIDNQGTYTDIRAQHINSAGSVLWTTGGEAIETDQTSNYTDNAPAPVSAGNGDAVIAWVRQPGSGATTDIHAQYIKDTVGSSCSETNSTSFCGTQQISNYVLTFTDIPESFNFGAITTGSTSNHCNNTSTLASPADLCSNSSSPSPPGTDDKLTVRDERSTGGFIVQVTTQGTFTDGTNTIPLSNLYLITSIDESDPNKEGGINYSAGFTGSKTVSTPLYVNETVADISDPILYTTGWPFQSAPYSALRTSQFGGYPLDLMVGTLPAAQGRNGDMSLFTNFNLKIDYDQLPGDYSLILTYDLTDSTT